MCRLAVPPESGCPQPGSFFHSELVQLLSTLLAAHVDLGCCLDAHPNVVTLKATTHLTAMAITAMPILSRLVVTLPTPAFADIGRCGSNVALYTMLPAPNEIGFKPQSPRG